MCTCKEREWEENLFMVLMLLPCYCSLVLFMTVYIYDSYIPLMEHKFLTSLSQLLALSHFFIHLLSVEIFCYSWTNSTIIKIFISLLLQRCSLARFKTWINWRSIMFISDFLTSIFHMQRAKCVLKSWNVEAKQQTLSWI